MCKNSRKSSPYASQPYSYGIMEYGFQHVWGSMGYASKEFWICSLLGEVFWASSKHYMGSGPSLHYVVPKA